MSEHEQHPLFDIGPEGKRGSGRIIHESDLEVAQTNEMTERMLAQIGETFTMTNRQLNGAKIEEKGEVRVLTLSFSDGISPQVVEIIGEFEVRGVIK